MTHTTTDEITLFSCALIMIVVQVYNNTDKKYGKKLYTILTFQNLCTPANLSCCYYVSLTMIIDVTNQKMYIITYENSAQHTSILFIKVHKTVAESSERMFYTTKM